SRWNNRWQHVWGWGTRGGNWSSAVIGGLDGDKSSHVNSLRQSGRKLPNCVQHKPAEDQLDASVARSDDQHLRSVQCKSNNSTTVLQGMGIFRKPAYPGTEFVCGNQLGPVAIWTKRQQLFHRFWHKSGKLYKLVSNGWLHADKFVPIHRLRLSNKSGKVFQGKRTMRDI